MSTIELGGNTIYINFSLPIEETGYIGEDFNYKNKPSYATIGIQEILKYNENTTIQIILGTIFQTYYKKAQEVKLDYLQSLIINGIEVWIIDNGDSICLLTKEEY